MKQVIAGMLAKHVKLKKEQILNLIEIPPDSNLGDYAFPCFVLAKKLKKNPADIATQLANKIKAKPEISEVKALEGYLNFFIDKKKLAEKVVREILKQRERYGGGKGKGKALIEHTSINPNASPHVGRARNSIIGDSIKRILEFSGLKTETHYYINDVSKQIVMLTLNCTGKEKFSQLLKKYQEISKRIEKSKKLEKKVFENLNKFEAGDKKTVNKIKKIVNTAVKGQKKIMSEFGIQFDYFDYESDYLKKAREILKRLEKTKKLFTDKQGRKILNQKNMGLEKSMKTPVLVLARSDGTGLYPLRDLAYTLYKLKRAKKNIIVLGEDQKLYFKQLSAALKILKEKAPEVLHYSYVLIQSRGRGKAKKMSTRKGNLVLLEDFMKEAEQKAKREIKKRKTKGDAKKIAYSAVKYSILKNSLDKNIIFNLEYALGFEGDTGPYLQYSYARASSILRKAKKKLSLKFKIIDLKDSEIALIKKLSQFPEIARKAEKQLNPSLIANYSFELAQIFNEFYHASKVIGTKQEAFRLALVEAFRIVIKSSLHLLGIEVMEEM